MKEDIIFSSIFFGVCKKSDKIEKLSFHFVSLDT
jgi:hypothetical protein